MTSLVSTELVWHHWCQHREKWHHWCQHRDSVTSLVSTQINVTSLVSTQRQRDITDVYTEKSDINGVRPIQYILKRIHWKFAYNIRFHVSPIQYTLWTNNTLELLHITFVLGNNYIRLQWFIIVLCYLITNVGKQGWPEAILNVSRRREGK